MIIPRDLATPAAVGCVERRREEWRAEERKRFTREAMTVVVQSSSGTVGMLNRKFQVHSKLEMEEGVASDANAGFLEDS